MRARGWGPYLLVLGGLRHMSVEGGAVMVNFSDMVGGWARKGGRDGEIGES